MNKIFLIARREFLVRVLKRTFLVTTILFPVIMVGFYAMMIYFSISGGDNYKIAVADEANIFHEKIENDDEISFEFLHNETPATLKTKLESGSYDGYVYIPSATRLLYNDSLQVVTSKSVAVMSREKIQDRINETLEQQRLLSLNISKEQLDSARKSNEINFITLQGSNDSDVKAGVSYGIGFISAFLIYLVLFIYGTMVMRGVTEEKVSRIAEVIISSVKPFQLMLGKIFGIGAVGLLQFIIWIILVGGLQFLLPVIFPEMLHQIPQQGMQMPGGMGAAQTMQTSGAMQGIMEGLSQINFPLIIGCFIFYFLGGYLLYSSLFAAVGSTVNEDPQDAQSLSL
ncbi:MAG: ABC transporter permease, partial [Parafilimonas sp.]